MNKISLITVAKTKAITKLLNESEINSHTKLRLSFNGIHRREGFFFF